MSFRGARQREPGIQAPSAEDASLESEDWIPGSPLRGAPE
jgi:hypothetical protein